jgi:hypothetical protein
VNLLTIEPWGLLLQKSVPMEADTLVWSRDLVVYGDLNVIAPVGFNGGLKEKSVSVIPKSRQQTELTPGNCPLIKITFFW